LVDRSEIKLLSAIEKLIKRPIDRIEIDGWDPVAVTRAPAEKAEKAATTEKKGERRAEPRRSAPSSDRSRHVARPSQGGSRGRPAARATRPEGTRERPAAAGTTGNGEVSRSDRRPAPRAVLLGKTGR